MGNTTEQLNKLLRASTLTVISWVNGKAVKTFPKGWGMNGKREK
jgi:hypothetical protein